MKKLGWKKIVRAIIIIMVCAFLFIPREQMHVVSPSGRKTAVLTYQPFDIFYSRLYVFEKGKFPRFIGRVWNEPIDMVTGIIWKPDESELAVANDDDGSPYIVVIIDLNDKRGIVTAPPPHMVSGYRYDSKVLEKWPERRYTEDTVRRLVKSRYSRRGASVSDLNWLSEPLSRIGGLDYYRRTLGLEPVENAK